MKDNDQNLDLPESFDDDVNTHTIQGASTLILDTSSPQGMLNGLIATLGELYGNQMFSNLTGIHELNGVLIPSCMTDYDILH